RVDALRAGITIRKSGDKRTAMVWNGPRGSGETALYSTGPVQATPGWALFQGKDLNAVVALVHDEQLAIRAESQTARGIEFACSRPAPAETHQKLPLG